MAELPISLDNLISYVRSIHGEADPLDNLADAVQVASALDEQSDALIGYFVDQARRAGAPWSEIGMSMGVSKQAVQKRFTAKTEIDDFDPDNRPFSRFTDRARHVVAVARIAAGAASSGATTAGHLAVALLSEPDGVAAKVIHAAGVSDEQFTEAFAIALPPADAATPPQGQVPFSDDGKNALREALRAALRLGHNYIGTEHILLGILRGGGPAAGTFDELGLTIADLEAAITEAIAGLLQRMTKS
jgi:ATP-dependent Clp protease ATP-binding subunit ClpA